MLPFPYIGTDEEEAVRRLTGMGVAPMVPPPPPEMAPPIAPKLPPPPNTFPGRPAPTAVTDYNAALQQGLPQRPEPKWWQRLAAAGVGGVAGAVNAGRRTHIPEETVSRATEGILRPGYAGRLDRHLQELALKKQAAESAMRQDQALDRTAETQARIAASQAAREASEASARYQTRRTEQIGTERFVNTAQGIFDKQTGQYVRPDIWGERVRNADAMKLTGDVRNQYLAEGKLPEWYGKPAPPERPIRVGNQLVKPDNEGGYSPVYTAPSSEKPLTPSAEATKRKESVRRAADRVIAENMQKGSTNLDDAIRNVQQFYQGDPELGNQQFKAEVISEIQRRKPKTGKRGGSGFIDQALGKDGKSSGPSGKPPSKGKATKAQVQSYATQKGVSYDEAKRQAIAEGWEVME